MVQDSRCVSIVADCLDYKAEGALPRCPTQSETLRIAWRSVVLPPSLDLAFSFASAQSATQQRSGRPRGGAGATALRNQVLDGWYDLARDGPHHAVLLSASNSHDSPGGGGESRGGGGVEQVVRSSKAEVARDTLAYHIDVVAHHAYALAFFFSPTSSAAGDRETASAEKTPPSQASANATALAASLTRVLRALHVHLASLSTPSATSAERASEVASEMDKVVLRACVDEVARGLAARDALVRFATRAILQCHQHGSSTAADKRRRRKVRVWTFGSGGGSRTRAVPRQRTSEQAQAQPGPDDQAQEQDDIEDDDDDDDRVAHVLSSVLLSLLLPSADEQSRAQIDELTISIGETRPSCDGVHLAARLARVLDKVKAQREMLESLWRRPPPPRRRAPEWHAGLGTSYDGSSLGPGQHTAEAAGLDVPPRTSLSEMLSTLGLAGGATTATAEPTTTAIPPMMRGRKDDEPGPSVRIELVPDGELLASVLGASSSSSAAADDGDDDDERHVILVHAHLIAPRPAPTTLSEALADSAQDDDKLPSRGGGECIVWCEKLEAALVRAAAANKVANGEEVEVLALGLTDNVVSYHAASVVASRDDAQQRGGGGTQQQGEIGAEDDDDDDGQGDHELVASWTPALSRWFTQARVDEHLARLAEHVDVRACRPLTGAGSGFPSPERLERVELREVSLELGAGVRRDTLLAVAAERHEMERRLFGPSCIP